MNLYITEDNEFIDKLSKIILDNLGNENFGVNELIKASGVNKNYLGRRIKSIKKITVNQFITEVRLKKAHEFLLEGTYTAAEVSYNTGFSSPSYFNRCFHEYFGYPPGDIKKRTTNISGSKVSESNSVNTPNNKTGAANLFKSKKSKLISIFASILVLAGIIFIYIYFF